MTRTLGKNYLTVAREERESVADYRARVNNLMWAMHDAGYQVLVENDGGCEDVMILGYAYADESLGDSRFALVSAEQEEQLLDKDEGKNNRGYDEDEDEDEDNKNDDYPSW